MSPRLIQPGLPAALPVHPFTGLRAIGILPSGKVVWPVKGGAPDPDDPNDPTFTGEDDEDDDEEDEEDEEDPKGKKSSKSKKSEDDDEDDDDEGSSAAKASRQAKRYRLALRAEQEKNRQMSDRLKALEDKDKKPDEVASRDLTEARSTIEKLSAQNGQMAAQLAFFRVNTIEWADPTDAFALAEREGLFEDVVDEDGTVDARELRRGLRDLARRKPHLVKKVEDDKKARGRKSTDDDQDDEEEDDEEPRSRRSGSTMNGSRRGKKGTAPSRAELAKKFPVLNRV